MDDTSHGVRSPHELLSTAQRGYGSRWQRERERYLAEHPLCVFHEAQGKFVPALIVDHKIPHRLAEARLSGDDVRIRAALKLFWDRKNWQSLCKLCHDSVKQAQEKSGLAGGCGLDGVPLDANHHWNR